MAVVGESKEKMVVPNMTEDSHPARILDHWYIWDKPKEYQGKKSLVDKVVIRFAMDPEDVGTIEYQGKQVQRWFDTYWSVNGQRYVPEPTGDDNDFIKRVYKTIKEQAVDATGEPAVDENGKPIMVEKEVPYKPGEKVMKDDYFRYVNDYSGSIPVKIDDNGEPETFIGPNHAIYKLFKKCWKEDFEVSLKSGDVTFEGLMDLQVVIVTELGSEKKDGTRWENVISMKPGAEGQSVPLPEGYVRVKDREQESLPF